MRPESFRTITNNSMATSWPIKFYTATKLGVKRKSNNDALNKNNEKYEAYRKWLFLGILTSTQVFEYYSEGPSIEYNFRTRILA